ncbi:MAG TPA: hypothetical protein VFT75_12910 [Nocardioidaceae bacterium]|jgi:hypothetical protein|nr:hypothetical protein [Nocardioidaceae bacterium]
MAISGAILVGIIILAIVGFVVITRATVKVSKSADSADDPRVDSLYYPVPHGQDPVVLVAAMKEAGYESSADTKDGQIFLVVNTPAGRDRERPKVRQVIASASHTSLEGPEFDPGRIVFVDEQQGAT